MFKIGRDRFLKLKEHLISRLDRKKTLNGAGQLTIRVVGPFLNNFEICVQSTSVDMDIQFSWLDKSTKKFEKLEEWLYF